MRGFEFFLTWCLLTTNLHHHWTTANSQFFDNNSEYNQRRVQDPYNIFNNQSLERTALQDKFNRDYALNSNLNSQTGSTKYYTNNTTYRTRGNSTEFHSDPINYHSDTIHTFNYSTKFSDNNNYNENDDNNNNNPHPLDKLTALNLGGENRRLQNYAGRTYPDNYFDSNSAYNVNNNNNNNNNNYNTQGPEHRSYEESFRDSSYDQRARERDSGGRRPDDYSVTSRSNTNYNSNNNNNVYNSNYPGAGTSYYDRDRDRNPIVNSNTNVNNPQRPAFGPGSGSYDNSNNRGRPGYPDQSNSGTGFSSGGGGGQNPNYNPNRPGPVFDPGYPYKNIWNEHWSTTTDRPTAAGVLGKWRPDLQGAQRPEDIHQIPQAVYVTTAYGRVQGFKTKLYDGPWVPLPARPGIANVDKVQKTVSSFVGIPYARPPILDGRFRPPRPHTGWQLLQAVEFGPACPQPSRFFGYTAGIVSVDEDCLYLNVFSPDVGSGAKGAPFPVIFYIHDGDFTHGASNQFPPHQLVAYYDLVVVTVNFRLGAIGFLSTADEHSPGNYGMLDLSLALKWVHSNIRSFNGDPDRITLVGLGSGGAAAGLLMLSPRSRQYVKNVVAMEGAPTADWAAIVDKYRLQNTTNLLSMKLGCWQQYEQTSWKMVQCLRSRSWQELANVELEPDVGTFPWSPAVDKEFRVPKDDILNDWKEEDWKFLPDDPLNLLKHGEYPYVKYMTGFARQSAADLLYANKTLAPNYIVTREWFDQMIHRWVMKYNYTLNPESVFQAIRYAYTYWPDPQNTTHLREEYINFLSDALYRSPIDQTVKLLLARGIQVHSYLMNYTLEGLRLPFWREVPRGLEYYLLSGAPFMDPEFYPERLRVDRFAWTEGDRNMSNFFMTSVANMAHFGHPTPHEVLGIYWERATPADLKYLALNATINSTMQRNYRQRELTFWSEYMPSVVGRYYNTYPPTTEYWWEPNEPLQIAFWSVSGICLILVVILVACFLLWRTAKKQRDRIYDDLGLVNGPPLGIGTIVGDEISEYAETVKTADSMDSGVKLTHHHHPQLHPHPGSQNSTNVTLHHMGYPTPPPIHAHRERDRFPTPKRTMRDRERETPQTQV